LAGRLAKKGDELAKLPQHTTHGWSALVWARLETINPNDDPIDPNDHASVAAEYKDKLLRVLAEMENLRRRTDREIADDEHGPFVAKEV
jgi:molecular chaperone GrpE (heat shock protein)